jgi:hypothetical protein
MADGAPLRGPEGQPLLLAPSDAFEDVSTTGLCGDPRGWSRRRRRRVAWAAGAILTLALGVALSMFFLWPRPPAVSARGVAPSSKGIPVTISNGGTKLSLALTVRVSVENPNFVSVALTNLSLAVTAVCAPGGRAIGHIGLPKANQVDGLSFPARATRSADLAVNVVTTDVVALACMTAELARTGEIEFRFAGTAQIIVLRDEMFVDLDFQNSFKGRQIAGVKASPVVP